jgi:hypothetical protein
LKRNFILIDCLSPQTAAESFLTEKPIFFLTPQSDQRKLLWGFRKKGFWAKTCSKWLEMAPNDNNFDFFWKK